jgi:hypothetical protein
MHVFQHFFQEEGQERESNLTYTGNIKKFVHIEAKIKWLPGDERSNKQGDAGQRQKFSVTL